VKNANTRRSGIPGVGNIGWGEHLCALYNRKQELLKLVVSFIEAGLLDNEFCMWITGEPITQRDAFEALEAVLPEAHEYLIRKRLEILPYHQSYLSSGAFNQKMVLENWLSSSLRRSQGLCRYSHHGEPLLASVRRGVGTVRML
jgi:hypothetical protein